MQLTPFSIERHDLSTALTPQECDDRLKALRGRFRIAEHPQSVEIIRHHVISRTKPFAMSTSALCRFEPRSNGTHVSVHISLEHNALLRLSINAFLALLFPILLFVLVMLNSSRQQWWILLVAVVAIVISYRQYINSWRSARSDRRLLLRTVVKTLEAEELAVSPNDSR